MNRTCIACDAPIGHRSRLVKTCSTACSQWARKHPGSPRPTRRCGACDKSLEGRGPQTKFCDKRCQWWASKHPGIPFPTGRTCEGCGENIDHLNLQARTCSNACQRWKDSHPDGRLRNAPKTCATCDGPIVGRRVDTTFCSTICRERDPRHAERSRDKARKRRAVVRGAKADEPVRAVDVFERDNWTCQICSLPIDRSAPWPYPMSPSIDHVIPLSRGGMHSMANLRAAHLRCNLQKGATIDALERAG
jgi:5-methylcytosine-specific restriction endonuclease McrA